MKWVARALSVPSADTDACLSVFFESTPSNKYLFNCSEGTFRAIQQRKVGLSRIKALFLTRIHTQRSSGVPSLLMSLADSGSSSFTIIGPEGLNHYLATTRSYAMRENLEVKATEASFSPIGGQCPTTPLVFRDENLSVYAVPIDPRRYRPEDSTPSPPSFRSAKRKASRTPSPVGEGERHSLLPSSPQARIVCQTYCGLKPDDGQQGELSRSRKLPMNWELHARRLPYAQRATAAVSFIGLGPSVRGKFDAKRAQALGVFGSDRARLTRGETVLSKDGVTSVTPDMCIGPGISPSAFMFIECPSTEYIPGIASSLTLGVNGPLSAARLSFIIHRVGRGVLEDERYVAWMHAFGADVEHLIASDEYGANPVAYTSSSYIQLSLAELDDRIFRIPSNRLEPIKPVPGSLPTNSKPLLLDHQIGMHPPACSSVVSPMGMKDEFHPALQKIREGDTKSVLSPDMYQTINLIHEEAHLEEDSRTKEPGDDVVITTLGTGSALPSKTRNVLANLVQIPHQGNILLDAGEGTWGQIARRFGQDTTDSTGVPSPESILRDLKCVFISHIHADHHLGLAKLLSLRRTIDPPPEHPIYLIANVQTFDYLEEYHDLEDLGINNLSYVRKIHSADISTATQIPSRERLRLSSEELSDRVNLSNKHLVELKGSLGMSSVQTVDVQHRGPCYGIVFKHIEGWSIVFSGDTMPCDALAEAGRSATVLIHEATMADDEEELARGKQHSTVGQAIKVGKQMEAKHILLTHFSQRYPKITNLNSAPSATNTCTLTQSTNAASNVALAFDGAAVPIGSLWKLSKYTPALEKLFAETAAVIGEDEEDLTVPARENTQREGMASDSATDLRTATSGEREIPPIREKKKPKRIAERQ
ncbi:uncharacterized protein EI90DRAFT_1391010 [Cantharellus anzutake]|uniref:uncharacterized protein n=1 Tax=Cantharellus anzutake TaxID=1750568 RepID=UPI00190686C0|nr:uncharacterized protein EI90DRAFT_1391010 [Cantharellus anzutake]KAF8329413.1 hypothetical protein EI90DRAFT_1391010 [Cantharellus anzutake]